MQYRWLLLRGGAAGSQQHTITSSDLVAARYNLRKHSRHAGASEAAPHQPSGNGKPSGTNNDVLGTNSAGQEQSSLSSELVELTSASYGAPDLTAAGRTSSASISTLDLSNMSIDRKQAGHYICEASNKLGKTRQSIYVNVLCK